MSLHFTISGLCPISASLSLFHSITVTTTTSLRCGVRNGADNKRYVLRTYTISGLFVFYVIAFISLDLHRHEAHKIRKKHTYMTPRDGKMRQQYVRLRYLGNSQVLLFSNFPLSILILPRLGINHHGGSKQFPLSHLRTYVPTNVRTLNIRRIRRT